MVVKLSKYNFKVYERILNGFAYSKKGCFFQPSGTGKTYIALKWLSDNDDKKALFLTPYLSVVSEIKRIIVDNDFYVPNLDIFTYDSLNDGFDINQYEMIILDEFYYIKTLDNFDYIKEMFSQFSNFVLGMSSDMVFDDISINSFFGGNVFSRITLPFFIANGILDIPVYIKSISSFDKELAELDFVCNLALSSEKSLFEKRMKKLRNRINVLTSIEELFSKHLSSFDGKYLIFSDRNDLYDYFSDRCQKYFSLVNSNIDFSSIQVGGSQDYNKYVLDRFNYVKNNKIKVLCCGDVVNSGVSFSSLNGVIIENSEVSSLSFMKFFNGACFSSNLVFDISDDISYFNNVDNLKNVVIKMMNNMGKSSFEIDAVSDKFLIIDEYKDIISYVNNLKKLFKYDWNKKYSMLLEYVNKYKKFPDDENTFLGMFLKDQQELFANKKLDFDKVSYLDKLGNWNSSVLVKRDYGLDKKTSDNYRWEKKYDELYLFYKENGFFPTVRDSAIGSWLGTQKRNYKLGLLDDWKIEKLNLIGNWNFDIREKQRDDMWESKYNELCLFYKVNDKLPSYSEPLLGPWLCTQRSLQREGKLSKYRYKKLNKLGCFVDAVKKYKDDIEEAWMINFNVLSDFVASYNKFPPKSVSIGVWLKNQRAAFRKGKLSERREELLDSLGEWGKYPKK